MPPVMDHGEPTPVKTLMFPTRTPMFDSMEIDHHRHAIIQAITDLLAQAHYAESDQELALVRRVLRESETMVAAAVDTVGALQDQRENER
jgi:hypothetical protein